MNKEKIKIKCKCGCGTLIDNLDNRCRKKFYVVGHNLITFEKGHRAWNTGKKLTEKQKEKLKGREVWNTGKKNIYSEETLEKMRNKKLGTNFRKGKLASEVTKKNIKDAKLFFWKDKKQSEELRRKKLKAKELAKKIPLKEDCEICHSKVNLQRHHWNYNQPLLVVTLCKECHTIQHVKNFWKSKYARQEVLA